MLTGPRGAPKLRAAQAQGPASDAARRLISPEDLRVLSPPKVNGSKGVILSGRGPIWLYCFLTHFYHPTKFIATYDPRLQGAVIVETHSTAYLIGTVLNISQDNLEESS